MSIRYQVSWTAMVDGEVKPWGRCDASGNLLVAPGAGVSLAGTEYTEDAAAAANPAGGALILIRRDTLTAAEVSADGDNVAAKATAKGEIYTKDTDVAAALTTLAGYLDGLEGFSDGIEGLITSTNTLLTTQAGYVDGLETLLTTQSGYLDGVEGLIGTGNTSLGSILAKIIAAPATEAKQDTGNTSLASILTSVDGIETLIGSTNTLLTTQNGYLDGVEGFVDGLEAVLGTTSGAAVVTDANGSIQQYIRGIIVTLIARLPAALGAQTGAGSLSVVAASDGKFVIEPHALTASRWQYAAAASGIANTATAVTFKTADGSLRNYVAAMQIMWEALGTATELAIRDGAAGTVLWRMKIPAGLAGTRDIVFPVPLKGTAATLLEVVTLTASTTGAVYFDAQGFVAA